MLFKRKSTLGTWKDCLFASEVELLHVLNHRSPNRVFEQRGAIVNCASVNSVLSGAATLSYTASKHAVVGITKAVSHSSMISKPLLIWICLLRLLWKQD